MISKSTENHAPQSPFFGPLAGKADCYCRGKYTRWKKRALRSVPTATWARIGSRTYTKIRDVTVRPGRCSKPFLPFPTQTAWFCCLEADRFCVSASLKLQPGSEQLMSRQRPAWWQEARLMKWFHYYKLNQAQSLFEVTLGFDCSRVAFRTAGVQAGWPRPPFPSVVNDWTWGNFSDIFNSG